MKLNYSKVVEHILNADKRRLWGRFLNGYLNTPITLCLKPGAECYTCDDYYDGPIVVIGREFYQVVHKLPDEVDSLDLKTHVYKDMTDELIGVVLHEFFHRRFTNMEYAYSLLCKLPREHRGFVHRIHNILEDVTIENSGAQLFRNFRYYINKINAIHFQPHCIEGMKEALEKHPNSVHTLTAFLLMYTRGYDMSTLPRYDLFENNKEFFEEYINACKYDRINTSRHRTQFKFAIQLLKLINNEDLEQDDKDFIENKLPKIPGGNPGPGEPKDIIDVIDILNPIDPKGGTRTSGDGHEAEEYDPSATDEMSKTETKNTVQAGRDDKDMEYDPAMLGSDLTKAGIEQIANDDPVTRYSHDVKRIDDYMNMSKYAPTYKEVVKKFADLSNKFVSVIRKMRSQNGKRVMRGQSSGKFDIRAYIAGKPVNRMFMKEIAPNALPDPVIYFFLDNSGSMSGNKAVLAGEACIPMCEALNSLNVPFAVYAFTECNSCITIELKSTKDLWDKVKYNLTLFTNNVRCKECATYWGNIDEVNLRYVRDKLLLEPAKDKIMIIISDGATCGSREDLKKVAEGMEKKGVKVLAIGIYDQNVKGIYKNYVICKNQKDLEKLPEFLNNYLVKSLGGE